jgi:hydroxyacylglutathione hydrolase
MEIQVFPSGLLETNVYLVSDSGEAIVIDPASGSFLKIMKAKAEQKLHIASIFITHSHWDHVGDLKKLQEALSVPVYIHEKDGQESITSCPHKFLQDHDELRVGTLSFQVIHTPGHTEGSCCLYCKSENILFSGDTLFQGTCGNLAFSRTSREDMLSSLKKLSKLPKETRVLCGHGEATEIGKEEWLSHPEVVVDSD